MNSNRNGWDSTKLSKIPYNERWEKIERYIQSIKNIYVKIKSLKL